MRPSQMIKGAMKSPGRRAIVAAVPVVIAAGVLWTTGVLPRWVGMQTGAPAAPITFIPGTPGTTSWASSYEDFGELCNLSDLVVVGVADRIVELLPADWGHSETCPTK